MTCGPGRHARCPHQSVVGVEESVTGTVLVAGQVPGVRSRPPRDIPFPQFVGSGLDGELPAAFVRIVAADLGGRQGRVISASAAKATLPILDWFPSEATALAIGAALGFRGLAEVRDHGGTVQMDDQSATAYCISAGLIFEHNELASVIAETRSLDSVELAVREARGRSELEYERVKAAGRTSIRSVSDIETAAVNLLEAARNRGVGWMTYRRLAEQLKIPTQDAAVLAQRIDPGNRDTRPLIRIAR